jgi:hypothetical protein
LVLLPDLLQHLVISDPSHVVRFLALEALARVPGTSPESLREAAELALRDPYEAVQDQAWEILDALEATSRPAEGTEPPPGQEGAVSR